MAIDLKALLIGKDGDYEARVEAELHNKRVMHSQELIKVRMNI